MIFLGHEMGMTRQETLTTRYGEFIDMVRCRAIMLGNAKQKPPKINMDIWEFLALE